MDSIESCSEENTKTLSNITLTKLYTNDLFHRCWRLQSCNACLSSGDQCGWCAVSQSCVPNVDHGTLLPILAPIRNDDICPLGWQERWELRTRTFGCRCSNMTFISVVVAVLSTLIGVLLLWMIVRLSRWGVKRWKNRGKEWWKLDLTNFGWTRFSRWRRKGTTNQPEPEEIGQEESRPLLS
jgi:hypothetical protein